MRVVINQSNFLPWKGYFDLINDADLFIFLDHVQYTKRDWRHRNQIKLRTGLKWIHASVREDVALRIDQIRFKADGWEEKALSLIQDAYRKTPHFRWVQPLLEDVFVDGKWESLSELNQHLIQRICRDYLGVKTRFARSTDFGVRSAKQELIVDLLRAAGATTYISGPAARAYLDESRFQEEGLELIWKDYGGYPEYEQLYPPFEHRVSIIDLLVHTGPEAPQYIWGWRGSR